MAEFFHMGGYAIFVWASYGAALLLMLGLAIISYVEFRRSKARVDALERDTAARPRRAAMPVSGTGSSGPAS